MMAEWTTAGGALVLPKTCGPVPVKSNTADEVALSMVTSRRIGVPSSIRSSALMIEDATFPSPSSSSSSSSSSPYATQARSAKSRSMSRTARSAFRWMNSM